MSSRIGWVSLGGGLAAGVRAGPLLAPPPPRPPPPAAPPRGGGPASSRMGEARLEQLWAGDAGPGAALLRLDRRPIRHFGIAQTRPWGQERQRRGAGVLPPDAF